MADIAQIGFASDSSGLVAAEKALDRLTPAAKRTEAAAAGTAGALGAAAAAAAGVASATNNTVRVITAANGALNTQAANVNKVNDAYKKLADTQKRINDLTGVNTKSDTSARAADIKAYGDEMDRLRAKFNPLFAAGQQYKATLTEINMAHRVGAITQKEQQAAIEATKTGFINQVNVMRGVRAQTQGLSHDAKNLSFQLVDVAQGIGSGISTMQIFAQQAGQIGQVLATSEKGAKGLFNEIRAGIMRVLTPMTLLVAGVAALSIGLLMLYKSAYDDAKAMDDLSKSTDVAMGRLRALQQVANVKGISKEDFASGMTAFADKAYEANQNVGSLRGLMIANNMQAKSFNEYLGNVADLVSRTNSGIQKRNILEAAGLPTTLEWVKYMNMGKKGIEAAAAATIGWNEAAERNLVKKAREFDEAWNKSWTNFAQRSKSSAVTAGEAIGNAWAIFRQLQAARSGMYGSLPAETPAEKIAARGGSFTPTGNQDALRSGLENRAKTMNPSTAGPEPKTQAQLLAENQQLQQRISILGELATVEQQVTAKQLELNAAGLQGVGVSGKQAAAILNATRAQAEMNKVNQQASIGIFNVAAANKAAADTLQMWIDKGLVDKTNTEQMAAAKLVLARNIDQVRDAAAIAAAPLQQLKQLELDSSNLTKVLDQGLTGALTGLVSPMMDVLNGTQSISDGFKNMGIIVLKAIQEMIIKMLILAPIARALRASFGGFLGDGGASPADALAAGISPVAKGAAFFAKGGQFTNKLFNQPTPFMFAGGSKFGVMGEAGPEAVMPLRRGANGSLGVQMFGGGGGGSNDNFSIAYAPVYHLGGNATQDDLEQVKKSQRESERNFDSRVTSAIVKARKRNVNV